MLLICSVCIYDCLMYSFQISLFCALSPASSHVNFQSFDNCFVIIDINAVNGLLFVRLKFNLA